MRLLPAAPAAFCCWFQRSTRPSETTLLIRTPPNRRKKHGKSQGGKRLKILKCWQNHEQNQDMGKKWDIVIDVREFSLRCCCVESKRNCREWFWENKGSLQNLFATHLSLYLLQCFMICGAEHPHPTQVKFNLFLNCNNGYPANSCYHTAIWRWYPCINNHSSDNTVSLTLLLDKAP